MEKFEVVITVTEGFSKNFDVLQKLRVLFGEIKVLLTEVERFFTLLEVFLATMKQWRTAIKLFPKEIKLKLTAIEQVLIFPKRVFTGTEVTPVDEMFDEQIPFLQVSNQIS